MFNSLTTFAATIPDKVGDKNGNIVPMIAGIINAVIAVLGIVCVVVMVIGGVNYMTSSGDTGKVEKGKKTILYGMIGLVVCVLAFAIVNWTIGAIERGTSGQQQSEQQAETNNTPSNASTE